MDSNEWGKTPEERSRVILKRFEERLDRVWSGLSPVMDGDDVTLRPSDDEEMESLRSACAAIYWWEHKYCRYWYEEDERLTISAWAIEAIEALEQGAKARALKDEDGIMVFPGILRHTNRAAYEYLNYIREECLATWRHKPEAPLPPKPRQLTAEDLEAMHKVQEASRQWREQQT